MLQDSRTHKLGPLFDYLGSLTERAPVEELKRRPVGLDVDVEDLADYVHFSDQGYLRNLMGGGEHYDALLMCW